MIIAKMLIINTFSRTLHDTLVFRGPYNYESIRLCAESSYFSG